MKRAKRGKTTGTASNTHPLVELHIAVMPLGIMHMPVLMQGIMEPSADMHIMEPMAPQLCMGDMTNWPLCMVSITRK